MTVTYNPSIIKLDEIHSKIAAVGHDTELAKADEKVYNALPDCCLYKDPANEGHYVEEDAKVDVKNSVRGVVLSEDNKGNIVPMSGASILWAGSNTGVTSDNHGVFTIPKGNHQSKLVISYTGYQPDSVSIVNDKPLQVILAPDGVLSGITIKGRSRTTYINANSEFRSFMINPKDLLKAACCNLSESFETNPSVDVSYSDAVTGSKQIQLLGLSGTYTQLTVENLPGPRGLATPLGLNSIAGPWIESIQLSKGTGSVVNGYESIAGQINVELKKPENSDRLYLNGYLNSMGSSDLNLNLATQLNSKWSTGLLLHNSFLLNKVDDNKDGFRDLPTGNLFSGINRLSYDDGKGVMIQFGVKALFDDKTGGELSFDSKDKGTTNSYGLGINTQRLEGFAKIGYVFPGKKYQSVGLQLSYFDHQQESHFGLIKYNADQRNFYGNLIYQSIISNSDHKFRTGLSINADDYYEFYKDHSYTRREYVPGAFFEYTYTMNEKLSAVAGMRADHNSLYGWFGTPRLNVRYEPWSGTVMRLSAGRGQRTANIYAENMSTLVSARAVNILNASPGKAYGLDPEVAWNKGISIDQKLNLFTREAILSVDFFRNDFTNQIVVDVENPREVNFYNLDGKSYSNSFQVEMNMIPVKRLDVRIAYRYFDVKATYGDKLLSKPFNSPHRAFANLGYENSGWKLDYTVNYIGSKRIPSTVGNPVKYQMKDRSSAYITMNTQLSKTLGKEKNVDLYVGAENLTNFMQNNVILASDDPFGHFFDASMVWGPVSGRTIYAGFRFKIK
ncbi:MAG: TonB-dependent receptor [Ginsengibacter sp.]